MQYKKTKFTPKKTAYKKLKVTVSKKQASNAVEKQRVSNIKQIVKTVMKKNAELKIAQQIDLADNIDVTGTGLLYDGVANLRGWSSGPSNVNGIIPAVTAGTGEASRIGNSITPKSLTLKYFLQALPTTDASFVGGNTNPFKGVPFRARVIVYRHRYALDDFGQTNILQNGNSTVSFGSGIDNFFRPYNKDEYQIVYSKSVKLAACKHVSGAGGTTITTENVPNGSLSFYYGKATLPLPKTLRYNDGSSIPTNQSYFLAVCLCNDDSTPDSAGAYRRLRLNAETQLTFYDD